MITLRQMRYFASLARHRHFGRAADACGVTQPAMSMQIREFEREIGAELVERRPGEVALTETGLEVARQADRILALAQDLAGFAQHRDILTGPLRLGIIPTLAPYLLPNLLPRLQAKYPAAQLDIRETQTTTLLGELAAGELDCLVVALPVTAPETETLALFEDHFLLATSLDEQLPARPLTVDDIDPRRVILLEEGHCLREQALSFCAARQRGAPATLGSTSLTTVMQMVANGYGVTLLPEIAADAEVRGDRIKLSRFAAPEPGRSIGLVWRRTSSRRQDFEALGEIVKSSVS